LLHAFASAIKPIAGYAVLDFGTEAATVLMTRMNEAFGRRGSVCALLGIEELVGELVVVALEISSPWHQDHSAEVVWLFLQLRRVGMAPSLHLLRLRLTGDSLGLWSMNTVVFATRKLDFLTWNGERLS